MHDVPELCKSQIYIKIHEASDINFFHIEQGVENINPQQRHTPSAVSEENPLSFEAYRQD